MNPTLKDIAKSLGLSVATVSRALHDETSPNVSQTTRHRVRAVAEQIGYRPNHVGRALVTGRTHAISCWMVDTLSAYYAMVARSISLEAIQRGYYPVFSSLNQHRELRNAANPLMQVHADGLLACDISDESVEFHAHLRQARIPAVMMGIYPVTGYDLVRVDLETGAREAVEHLIASGGRRVAYLVSSDTFALPDPRNSAYLNAIQAAGMEPEIIRLSAQRRDLARQSVVEYVRAKGLPDAIFCVNDVVATGCYRGLCDLGARIPDDVAIVGCDGLEEMEYHFHPLSAVVQPVEAMCAVAWDFLERRLQEPDSPLQQKVLPSRLVIRESSRR